jgi:DNA-binding MarR family transcriptional regulator
VSITPAVQPRVDRATKEALLAYLDALTLAEPIQSRLWHEAGLTMTQLAVLRELRTGPRTASRLAAAVGLSAASVSHLVDRLERRSLVSRRRNAEDRRCIEIHLEAPGEKLLGETHVVRGSSLHSAVESMSGDERQQLAAVLRNLVDRTRAIAAERSAE